MANLDFSNTPRDLLLPDVLCNWEIVDIDDNVEAKTNKFSCKVCGTEKGRRMVVLTVQGLEPLDVKGQELSDRYTIGTETDPCAHDPATLVQKTRGAVEFGLLLDKLNVPRNDLKQILHKRFQAFVVTTMYDGADGKRPTNNLGMNKYPIGTMIPGQQTPDALYPKGKERHTSKNPTTSPAQLQTVPCPRCNQPFSAAEIDEHVADCSG